MRSRNAVPAPERLVNLVATLFLAAVVAGVSATPATANKVAAPKLELTVSQGLVTLEARDAPLGDVLRALAGAAGFNLELHGTLSGAVTRSFTDVPVERVIRQLARDQSLGFLYDPGPGGGVPRLIEVWVIESSPGVPAMASLNGPDRAAELRRLSALSAKGDAAAVAQLTALLRGDADPTVRAQAAAALSGTQQPEAARALEIALGDPDASVRLQAVHGVVSLEREGAVEAVGRLLLTDPDSRVRRTAAYRLGSLQSENVRAVLQAASLDTDPTVRRAASIALRRAARHGY